MRTLYIPLLLTVFLSTARAEDWTTSDGKTYKAITVVKVEDDAVTILDDDGGALVPLALLPPDLQQKFHYDPAKAKIAADKRKAASDASTQAIIDEKKAEEAQQAQAPQIAQTAPPPAPSLAKPAVTSTALAPSAPPSAQPSASNTTSGAQGGQFSLNRGTSSGDTGDHQKVNPKWKLVWSDEFDEDSIDKTKWNFEIDGGGGGNGEEEYYTDMKENAHIDNGHLLITAIKDGLDADGKKHKFTSARMTTKGKFSWKYGRFEARIKVPTGRGVWPAFWLMPEDAVYGGWASSGEIDIMEEVGDKPDTLFGTIHYGDKWPGNVHTGDKFIMPSGILADDWHVYAVEWEEGVIRWYIDGNLYETQTQWYTKAAPFPAPFDQNFFIIFNFAVGGAWPGKPSPSTPFPQTMDVDWVRVYQPATATASAN